MLNLHIQTIDHYHHRYDTVGDYFFDPELQVQKILVSDMNNWEYEFLVAMHELVEQALCRKRGIEEEEITAFDTEYECKRPPWDSESEPGDSRRAPYHKEHTIATAIERLLAEALGVNWLEYEKTITKLSLT